MKCGNPFHPHSLSIVFLKCADLSRYLWTVQYLYSMVARLHRRLFQSWFCGTVLSSKHSLLAACVGMEGADQGSEPLQADSPTPLFRLGCLITLICSNRIALPRFTVLPSLHSSTGGPSQCTFHLFLMEVCQGCDHKCSPLPPCPNRGQVLQMRG